MVIVQIAYRRPDMPRTDWDARYRPERARPFLDVEGLQRKVWLDRAKERLAGGFYLFADRATAETNVAGPIVARTKANPDIAELDIRAFDMRKNMSEITRAPIGAALGGSMALAAE